MSRQRIELSGIVRNLPDKTVKDGAMQELINLRPKDGALRPVGEKSRIASVPTDVRYIHTVSDELKIYIGTSGGHLHYWIYDDDTLQSDEATTITASSSMRFASLKNSVMVSDTTEEKIYILLYDQQQGIYKEYSQGVPEIPYVLFQRSHVHDDDKSETEDYSLESNWDEARIGSYVKMQKSYAEKGYLTGVILLRCAWKLFDGTIVKHTLPDQVLASTLSVTGSPVAATYRVTKEYAAYNVQYKLGIANDDLEALKANYKNIISSLKIYVTLPRSPEVTYTSKTATHVPYPTNDVLDFMRKAVGIRQTVNELTYDVSELSSYKPEVKDSNYYLLKEYKLSELEADTYVTINNDTVQDLSLREIMPVDNVSHHTLYADKLFSYNDRIFMGNVKNYLYSGPEVKGLITGLPALSYGDPYDVGIEYDILTDDKTILTVFSGWESYDYYDLGGTSIFFGVKYNTLAPVHSYWGYPDSRAIAARVYVRQNDIIKLAATKELESYPENNFSVTKGTIILSSFSAMTDGELQSSVNYYHDYNRVQATEINNPFYFPAINSYRIGLGTIQGMSTNAIALSEGQFGQYPIYCFTSDGIWTMNIGSGETLINTITPLSRHVCNNPMSITPIDGGTAFTTQKGLYIISGPEVILISDLVTGKHNSRITGTINYDAIANNPNLYQIKDYLCSNPFLTYLAGAIMAWDHHEDHKELIISNSSYPYSWIYNINHKLWFKISNSWDRFVTDYPNTYGYKTIEDTYFQYDMGEEEYNNYIPVHLETRPIKLTASGAFKMLNRILIEGSLSEPVKPFSINLFGSMDNISWHLMNNGKLFANGNMPLLIGRTSFSCRYFILVLGGEVDEDFYLIGADTDFDERYANKLR